MRVVHCKKEPHDVYIGRPSKWGNPFTVAEYGRGAALEKYRAWITTQPALLEQARLELAGKVLGCWCKPAACHGDVLVAVANESSKKEVRVMADKIKGELKVLKANDHGFYSVKIDNTWYGLGTKKQPDGIAVGDIVEGEFELEKGKYKTITKAGLTKAAKAAPTGAAGSAGTTSSSWQAKDDSIRYQSSRKDALAFYSIPGALSATGFDKAKPAEKIGVLEALIDKKTAEYFEDVATFGAVARANGTTTEDPAAPPADDSDDE